ncbi:YceI family protein [Corynebacterium sp.]|uniref:YceI family protein n=1 Tax=Corynebacterium sp. TaxID=1720 RepID=UPI0026DD0590|nr:YceI family protein [Corynebacterium sp.]MDO5031607.1 YceI family protein [Corynebacterium sp.]
MKKLLGNRKLVISIFVVLIVACSMVALGPLAYSLYMGRGVKTEPINAEHTKPATTELDGSWRVVKGSPHNFTSVGFTIDEILPAEKTATSGSTKDVTGQAEIKGTTVEEASIVVNMDELTTDKKVRDQNMKTKLFETSTYPAASFTLTKPVDLAEVPADGSLGKVELTGDLEIHGVSKEITQEFEVARDGETILLGGDIPVNRLEYGIETPEMIAAKISEVGAINVRVTLQK